MFVRVSARSLIEQAREVFDRESNGLAASAAGAWRGGFASGGQWMRLALEHLRGEPLSGPAFNLNVLGLTKYALACVAALIPVGLAAATGQPLIAILALPVFYAAEVQFVFLFPLAIDGCPRPFRASRRWTWLAGGTLPAMTVVMQLAATMLFGGFVGRGFVRSWCLGCLAVCIWYEELRTSGGHSDQTEAAEVPRLERRLVG